MTTVRKFEIELVLCVAMGVAFSSLFVLRAHKNASEPVQLAMPIIAGVSSQKALAPIQTNTAVIDSAPQVDTSFQLSPDGTKKLIMKTTHNKNGTLGYVFTTTDGQGGNELPLYTTTLSAGEGMSIPFNTWSPDNKYLFLQKNDGDAMVFKATGEEILPGQQYLDVKELFNAAGRKDAYKETTGWASPTLLVVNTITPENTKGSSYWFEVPSKAIIQLSSEF